MNEILAALQTVLDDEHARAVVEYRRVTIKKPLTAFAAKILARRLAEWGDANEAAEIMIEKCWRGFNKDWANDRTPNSRKPKSIGDIFRQDAIRKGILPNEQPDTKTERVGTSHGSRQDGSLGLFGGPALEAVSFRRH